MPKDRTQKPTANLVTESHPNLEEEIRRRAYELYETRGWEDGHDLEDWLRAEEEITGRAAHLSVMEQNGIERILSFDSGVDAFPGITRLS